MCVVPVLRCLPCRASAAAAAVQRGHPHAGGGRLQQHPRQPGALPAGQGQDRPPPHGEPPLGVHAELISTPISGVCLPAQLPTSPQRHTPALMINGCLRLTHFTGALVMERGGGVQGSLPGCVHAGPTACTAMPWAKTPMRLPPCACSAAPAPAHLCNRTQHTQRCFCAAAPTASGTSRSCPPSRTPCVARCASRVRLQESANDPLGLLKDQKMSHSVSSHGRSRPLQPASQPVRRRTTAAGHVFAGQGGLEVWPGVTIRARQYNLYGGPYKLEVYFT